MINKCMITITNQAKQRFETFINKSNTAKGVRLGVRTTGCSGLAYVVELTEKITDDDTTIDSAGVMLVISSKSLPFIRGSVVDYKKSGLNEGFVFENPNLTGECGCGESFTVNTNVL